MYPIFTIKIHYKKNRQIIDEKRKDSIYNDRMYKTYNTIIIKLSWLCVAVPSSLRI